MNAQIGGGPPVEPGAGVEARDGRLGVVEQVVVRPETGELAYLVVRRGWTDERVVVAADLVEAIPGRNEVRLRVTRQEALDQALSVPQETIAAQGVLQEGSALRIPILEERLVPDTRAVDLGELRVHRRVDEREERVRQPVRREHVDVQRVAVNRVVEAPVPQREEDGWLVISVMEEELVVTKRLVLKEELRIRKREVTEEQEVAETTRHERVELQDATAPGAGLVHGINEDAQRPASPTPLPAATDQRKGKRHRRRP
ncbi:MAG: hypothetical protein AVDCRST_MAG77-4385 [uncultured Chloroflexi bacterium]|uniref:DUF2382 domain-containing protein n=1 Tax=uncultured Chloroflexota bacterium TaxID=166587 RepID=A0A6J4JUP6_9CHLR|nr:MAG: hypothetical protein AVDCRST_MAG77-4385 [uncultured Chloroflexota bacterium]